MATKRPLLTRRTAWALIIGWLALACLTAWSGSSLADRAMDEDRAFLPQDGAAARFDAQRSDLIPPSERLDTATVVVTSKSPLGSADVEELRGLAADLQSDPKAMVERAGDPELAPDRTLAFVELGLSPSDDPSPAVEAVRTAARDRLARAGREVMVTGGAAADADLGDGDVDLWLLLVSAAVVACILATAYRSLVLWLLPVSVGVVAVVVSHSLTALLALTDVGVTELAASIATVVVFGVSTDYALLLLNRLHGSGHGGDRPAIVAAALSQVRTPILVSAGVIALVMMTLVVSPVPGIRGLGPTLALGVATAATACLTLLPAMLVVLPGRDRAAPGPSRPEGAGGQRWSRLANRVARRPRAAVALSAALLGLLVLGGTAWSSSADPLGQIPDSAESKRGAEALRQHLGKGIDASVDVLLTDDDQVAREVVARAQSIGAVPLGAASPWGNGHVLLKFRLAPDPYTAAWLDDLADFETVVAEVAPDAAVGGLAVEAAERDEAAKRQLRVVGPVLLLVLIVVLALWLRSPATAAVIVASSCLSCVAGWGALALLAPALSDSSTVASDVLLFGFLFLVAFGIDYVVFLVDSIRRAPPTSYDGRVSHGLAATGPVITAAGAVLAATFGTLLLLPEANVRQVGILVAVGVVIDTAVVRVLFVPGMLVLLGDRRPHERVAKATWRIRRIVSGRSTMLDRQICAQSATARQSKADDTRTGAGGTTSS